MSTTRRDDPNARLSQERYVNSAEIAELHGIGATAVAKRCALLTSPDARELVWFVQGRSLIEGGLKQMAKDLLKMFPEQIVCPLRGNIGEVSLNPIGIPPHSYMDAPGHITREEAVQLFLGTYRRRAGYQHPNVPSMVGFLIDFCINPRFPIWLKDEKTGVRKNVDGDEFQEFEPDDPVDPNLPYFNDAIGALVEYKRRYEERVRAEFCLTAIGQRAWKELDAAHKGKIMIIIDGLEGRGKTEAVRAWSRCHLGKARFASLDGTSTRTVQLRQLSKAVGTGFGTARKALEMQVLVQEVLQTSQMMIVIDEAHFFFNQSHRVFSRPEMLDWIDTALCNAGVPVALVTTPQFLICMGRAADQVGWNYRQFKRRCKRYVTLPPKNSPEDVEAVARKLLPDADKATIKQVMAYVALSKRDLSAVGDVVREAKVLAEEDGASRVTFEHVKRAIYEVLIPSDTPWAEMEKQLQNKKPGSKASQRAPALEPEADQEPVETRGRNISSRLLPGDSSGSRLRFQEADPALAAAQDLPVLSPV